MISESIRAKIKKLSLMLSSAEPNEVIAARNAIDRMLDSNGLSWHDFGELIDSPAPQPPEAREPSRYGGARPWQQVAETCLVNAARFSSKEVRFLHDMMHWYAQPSKKQLDWLAWLHQRNHNERADV
ncbi:hypothetical protein G5V57_02165 [Nordella sp. HKS 07]|uniref:hypothetical protein n=1 Tax=Nordella sp. HKS 07 TaxID=2712222 RepID=UPI0013E1EE07|nr:hypothetical protein [Nordella sp. HKS 07]QIG46666.1 hypothetical protein G5V57_02165 [Nordella sp. HKS 07]